MSAPDATRPRLLSVVLPVLNEGANIERAHREATRVMEWLAPRYDYEIGFTDNHSTDDSFAILDKLAARDPRVRVARFSRNFGYQNSILTGYALCRGDAAVQLDCDLQDPPDMIPELIESWEQGHRVVYGVRRSRAGSEGKALTAMRALFYRAMAGLSEDPLPIDAGDFRLIDRVVIDELVRLTDYNPYLRGSISWIGFQQTGIEYDRHAREAGETNFSASQLVSLAVDGLLAHSVLPLRLATYVGVATGVLALLGGVGFGVGRFAFGQAWPAGFATLALIMLFSLSLNAIFLGLIGEYLSRIFMQLKGRPLTIIEEARNLPEAPGSFRAGQPPERSRND